MLLVLDLGLERSWEETCGRLERDNIIFSERRDFEGSLGGCLVCLPVGILPLEFLLLLALFHSFELEYHPVVNCKLVLNQFQFPYAF